MASDNCKDVTSYSASIKRTNQPSILSSKRKASSDSNNGIDAFLSPSRDNEHLPNSASTQTSSSNSVSIEGTNQSTSATCTERKNKSGVWAYFRKLYDSKGNYKGMAACVFCGKDCQSTSEQGTSGLWKHLRDSCQRCPVDLRKELNELHKKKDKTQKLLSFHTTIEKDDGAKLFSWSFNQQESRMALVRMIIKDELPFSFVEGEGFREFIKVSAPMFHIPSRVTIARDCYSLFVEEKKKLRAFLDSQCQRVSLTIDIWTSIQNMSYLCLTAHFIDSNWTLHKRILNFSIVKNHKGVTISNVVDFCMKDWGLSKVMCITVDNAFSNGIAIQQLKKKLMKKNAFVLGGEAFHMRCFAHILQLIVKDGIDFSQGCIRRIRDVVKYIRGSPQRLDLFKKCCELVNIKFNASLQLDSPTRWNSTYLMLNVAVGYQKAFDRLENLDSMLLTEFEDNLPSEIDWIEARNLTKFLKRFYDVTCKLSGSFYCTSNLYFPEVMRILKDLTTFQNSKDHSLAEMGKQMRENFDKYWGSLRKMNVMLFVAVVLDPRYKMNYLRVKYTTYYSEKDAHDLVDRVRKALNELMEEYKVAHEQGQDLQNQPHIGDNEELIDTMEDDENEIDDYFLQMESEQKLASQEELDRYLEELPEKYTVEFDILGWWKINTMRYPVLSKVARDVLAIPSSTVASESAFSTGGRTLDRFKSSLTPTTAEVLICCQDWLRNSKTPIQPEESIEELESFESEIIQDPEMKDSVLSKTILDY